MRWMTLNGRGDLKGISETPLPNKWSGTTEQQVTKTRTRREGDNTFNLKKPLHIPPAIYSNATYQYFLFSKDKVRGFIFTLGGFEAPLKVPSLMATLGNTLLKQLLSLPKWHQLVQHHQYYSPSKRNDNYTLNICIDFWLLKQFNICCLI